MNSASRLSVADHPERAVGRVHQADRGLDDPPQRGLQVQAGADRDDRLQQAAHPVSGRHHGLQPGLQLGQQLVQLQVRQHLRAALSTRFHQILPGDGARPRGQPSAGQGSANPRKQSLTGRRVRDQAGWPRCLSLRRLPPWQAGPWSCLMACERPYRPGRPRADSRGERTVRNGTKGSPSAHR